MKKLIFLSVAFLLCISTVDAQKFLAPFDGISKKKTSYITLETGEEIECNLKKIKRAKKGLIKEVIVKVDGKKVSYPAEDIKHAYFPQSGLDKFAKFDSFMTDATQWGETSYEAERLKDGYALFQKIDIIVKGDERKLLMQLLNPFPGNRVKVYHDPGAAEKGGMKIGGIKVKKSLESNYYVSKDDKIAARLRDKDYKKQFDDLFGDCSMMKKEYGKKKSWKKFEEAVFAYNGECKSE